VDGHVVDFSKTFAHPPPPPPRLDHLGHPYPRARRWGWWPTTWGAARGGAGGNP